MHNKALTLSVAMHITALLLTTLPLRSCPAAGAASSSDKVTPLAPPPSRKVATTAPQYRMGDERIESAGVDIAAAPDSLLIEIDSNGFGNVFTAAEHWGAVLHAGIAYSDPGTLAVVIDRPSDFSALSGRYRPGDEVWLAFPDSFRRRVFEKIKDFCSKAHVGGPINRAVIAFTSTEPDYSEVRSVNVVNKVNEKRRTS